MGRSEGSQSRRVGCGGPRGARQQGGGLFVAGSERVADEDGNVVGQQHPAERGVQAVRQGRPQSGGRRA
ncbi:MAG: hypothetical protein HWD57_15170 [Candidatus Accumulibacter cognatus]|uniref:Uncharacterized protein n=1 Tax=Candidatus Accumulibacter cognatus TaxID=2954383 RepID=A0A7D5SRE8_9PROT|nr:MAG: hypothetical protein HWD57_15170 [Candidatus Accumulibacter cognatus]